MEDRDLHSTANATTDVPSARKTNVIPTETAIPASTVVPSESTGSLALLSEAELKAIEATTTRTIEKSMTKFEYSVESSFCSGESHVKLNAFAAYYAKRRQQQHNRNGRRYQPLHECPTASSTQLLSHASGSCHTTAVPARPGSLTAKDSTSFPHHTSAGSNRVSFSICLNFCPKTCRSEPVGRP